MSARLLVLASLLALTDGFTAPKGVWYKPRLSRTRRLSLPAAPLLVLEDPQDITASLDVSEAPSDMDMAEAPSIPDIVWPRRRWYILALYSLVGVLNFGMWLTYATLPLATDLAFNGAKPWMGHLLSIIVGFGYLVGALPAGHVLASDEDGAGVRRGLLWASWIALVGGGLRWLGGDMRVFWVALTGQLLVGIAQPFFMAAPAQLSMEWFPPREHALATSIAIMSQVLGQAIIFLAGPAVGSLRGLIVGQALAAAALLGAVWRFFTISPMVTAVRDACFISYDGDGDDGGGDGPNALAYEPLTSRELLLSRNFVVLALVAGLGIGMFWTCCTVIGQLLMPLAFSEAQMGLISFAFIGSGVLSLLIAGPILDRFKHYKAFMLTCCAAATASSACLVTATAARRFSPIIAICATLGFWLTAMRA